MGVHQQLRRDGELVADAALRPISGAVPCRSAVSTVHERILVAGAEPVDVPIQQWTSGTPVPATESDARGGLMADYWAAHTRGAVNLALDDMARAGTLDEAISASAKARIPTQNMLVVDSSGKAAWTLLGGVPDRASACQVDAHDGRCIGWILKDKPATNGQIESSRLWTANNRVVDGATLAEVGDGGYASAHAPGRFATTSMQSRRSPNVTCWPSSSMIARCSCSVGGGCCRTRPRACTPPHSLRSHQAPPPGMDVRNPPRSVIASCAHGGWPCTRACWTASPRPPKPHSASVS